MTKFTKLIAGAAAVGAMCFATQAGAVNLSVQFACASDYFKYCSKHRVGSKSVRTCMSHHLKIGIGGSAVHVSWVRK